MGGVFVNLTLPIHFLGIGPTRVSYTLIKTLVMQLVFQLPIIDLRQLMQTDEVMNIWPSADMTKAQVNEFMNKAPFIKNFGKIESSPAGYCCAVNCIKSNKLRENGFLLNNSTVPIFNSYKRLLADGIYTIQAEFGFTDQLESVLKFSAKEKLVHISDILSHYMGMPLEVQNMAAEDVNTNVAKTDQYNNYWTTIKLANLGEALSVNYNRATTKNKNQPVNDQYIVCGEACITLTFAADENIILPANAEKLDEFTIEGKLIQLYGYKWNFEERTFKVWLFKLTELEVLTSPPVTLALQNKRVNLFHLNAEKETMRILVNSFNPAKTNPAIRKYIKKTPTKIFRKERFSNPQDGVRNFALQSEKDKVQFTIDDLKKVLDEYSLANLKNLEQNMKAAPPKKSILFITSNPTDSNPIDFGEQFKKIDEALQKGTDRDYFTLLNIKTGVEREKIMEILYTNEPDYLHITLHNSEIQGLYFQDAGKNPDPMPAEEFAEYIKILTEQKKPEAVILCACNSLGHATAVKQYCNYAVGTNYVFPDDAAVVYANKFYTALFNGKKVNFCHDIAVQGIRFAKPPFKVKGGPEVYKIMQLL